jgi:hypothetical protein
VPYYGRSNFSDCSGAHKRKGVRTILFVVLSFAGAAAVFIRAAISQTVLQAGAIERVGLRPQSREGYA